MSLIFGMDENEYWRLARRDRRDHAYSWSARRARFPSRHADIWRGLQTSWNDWEWPDMFWFRIFQQAREGWSLNHFCEENRAFYEALPDRIEIWRGSNTSHPLAEHGMSWTTDKATAVWFAQRHAGVGGEPLLFRAVIHKGDVALAVMDRSEFEIVAFSPWSLREREQIHLTSDELAHLRATAVARFKAA